MKHLNTEEIPRYQKALDLMNKYESSNETTMRSSILEELNQITSVSEFEANEYYSSSSLEEFCASIAVIPANGNNLTKNEAKNIITKMSETTDISEQDYLFNKYSNAIEFVFQKNTGFLANALFQKDLPLAELLSELEDNNDAPIQL